MSIFHQSNLIKSKSLDSITKEFKNEEILIQGNLFILNKKNQIKNKIVKLYNLELILKTDRKIINLEKINFSIVNFEKIKDSNLINEGFRFKIIFKHNDKELNFIFKQKYIFTIWSIALKKICIQTNFKKKYKLLDLIHQSKESLIFKTQSNKNNKIFSVKIFSKEKIKNNKPNLENIFNEIILSKNIIHKNISNVSEIFESKNSIYLIQDYYNGGDLFSLIENKKISFNKRISLLKGVCEGLKVIHQFNIIHRDIKPKNILIKNINKPLDNNNVVIIDFGISQFNKHITQKIKGTIGFLAPEIFNNKIENKFSFKSDIYSLGILFYTVFTNNFPFNGKNEDEILKQNYLNKIDFNHFKLKKIPDLFFKLLISMLEKNIDKRVNIKNVLEIFNN